MRQTDGDFLMIVDANLASLKTDPDVKRSITYSVKPEGDDLVATASIEYFNQGSFDWKSTRYRTYTRIYVPKGSELLENGGYMDNDKLHGGRKAEATVSEELDKTVFSGFISIEPKTRGTLTVKYKLPRSLADAIEQDAYRLLVQKQPGTEAHALGVDITATKTIQSYSPAEGAQQEGKNLVFTTTLQHDRMFEVRFR